MDRDSLENQIFSWTSWQDEGPLSMGYSDVTLKVPVGEFEAGTKFPAAFLIGESSLLVFVEHDASGEVTKEHVFELVMSVGKRVEIPEHRDACDCGHEHH